MKIKIFDNVKDEKKLDKFWQILIILTILNNFWQCWQWWTLSTIFDFWQFWHIWPMLKILDRFDIVENVRWLWKKIKKFWQHLTIFVFKCWQSLPFFFLQFMTIFCFCFTVFTICVSLEIFQQFWQFWPLRQLQSYCLVTFETLITILTRTWINDNFCYLAVKSDTG